MASPARIHPKFDIKNVDRDGNALRVGDRVGFVMRGWFLPREQESFGVITEIDARGGIKIDAIENYRRFTTTGTPAFREKNVFFTHHIYDPKKKERRYAKQEGAYVLSLFRVNPDELERHIKEAQLKASRDGDETKSIAAAAARAAARKGR